MSLTSFEPALALSRFGLGSGPDGAAALGDAHALLLSEISDGAPVITGLPATPELLAQAHTYQMEKQTARKAANQAAEAAKTGMADTNIMAPSPLPQRPGKDDNPIRANLIAEIDARFGGTVKSPAIGFNERMVQFWANHFAVSTKKNQLVAITTGAFEREAIRPHVFGRFSDMLLAVETHPTMLLYLDNSQSVGPNSRAANYRPKAGKAKGGKRGLNENLGREIMELHTLGVGSGYTQTDVTTFAKILTGWSVARDHERDATPGTFVFRAAAHEPGAQTLMGKTYAQNGVAQGRAALLDLAHHPATAHHIALKLASHFVADDPPPALVARLRDTYLASDGDLAEVSRALISAPESWSPQLVKMRAPLGYMCALIRATGFTPKPQAILAAFNAMGQPLWQPAGPNGFPDTVAAWASPEGLATRMDVASVFAAHLPRADPRQFAHTLFGDRLSPATMQAVARAETHTQGLAIVFLSPEFMRC
ncbi:DUF1800 family protein [Asticcacaulis sp. EMRT-3]|uniref:DUF1800 domain-containing protein n=1 Tax=Asticcacaulis sp. EMRT-3 TaxID=3040349 RepID=UPI0024AFFA14|nr:DUF1800 family protein [Asticcacaulis sp. EMRT-3]MDI7773934.1 DUF1800 family protein [Asticcacaulis sp. EMRT-3]